MLTALCFALPESQINIQCITKYIGMNIKSNSRKKEADSSKILPTSVKRETRYNSSTYAGAGRKLACSTLAHFDWTRSDSCVKPLTGHATGIAPIADWADWAMNLELLYIS